MNRSPRRGPARPERQPPAAAIPDALVAELSRRLRQSLLDAVLRAGEGGPGAGQDGPVLTVPQAHPPLAPALLAQATPGPADRQRQMAEVYERCLAHYRNAVVPARGAATAPSLGSMPAEDDVGAAAAYFVAANLEVLHGEAATPQGLLALECQLAAVVRVSSAWSQAPARERQIYFEKLAVLGVLVHETARLAATQGPAARANVRQAAQRYLQDLLGLDPNALRLGDQGLRLADPTAVAANLQPA